MKQHIILIASIAAALTACTSAVSPDFVRAKAASDLDCAEQQVTIEQVNDSNFKATGCEKKATYVCGPSSMWQESICMREGTLGQ